MAAKIITALTTAVVSFLLSPAIPDPLTVYPSLSGG